MLHDADWNACNTFENPDRVTPRAHELHLERVQLRFALSAMFVATITLRLA